MADTKFLNEEYAVVRTPLDPATGQPLPACRYALFPGKALAYSEPEIVCLLYDSIRNQYPDTGMFLYNGREGADPLLNRKYSERLLTRWRNLGKPTVIIVTPEDKKFFRGILTEIPTVSVYDLFLQHNISGGCRRELFRISEPAPFGFEPAIRELAENMGATLYEPENSERADAAKIPFLTSSIDVRNAMQKQGFEAVHILELIYGMGRTNAHLERSEHDHDHHDHDAPPQVRDTQMDDAEKAALAELFLPAAQNRRLQELHDMLLLLFWQETASTPEEK